MRKKYKDFMEIEQLLPGELSLYKKTPIEIAEMVKHQLINYDQKKIDILEIDCLPDFHHGNDEGGIKNLFFSIERRINYTPKDWQVELLKGNGSYFGFKTEVIRSDLQNRIDKLSRAGFKVDHKILLIDSHQAYSVRRIGFGGLKDIILCYYEQAGIRRPGIPN